jgi:hypothetical protein
MLFTTVLIMLATQVDPAGAVDPGVDPVDPAGADDGEGAVDPAGAVEAPADPAHVVTDAATGLDGPALAAVLGLQEALAGDARGVDEGQVAAATIVVGAVVDARLIPLLIGLSRRPGRARQAALSTLGLFLDDERVRIRLREAIAGNAPAEDVVTALPLLLKAGVQAGPPAAMPCPEGFVCQPDDVVFAAYVAYTDSSVVGLDVDALSALGALTDPRLVPLFVRLSLGSQGPARDAALDALVNIIKTGPEARARARLLAGLTLGEAEGLKVLEGVRALDGDDVEATSAILAARRRFTDEGPYRTALEGVLRVRDNDALEALLLAEREAPKPFDTTNRWILSLGAGFAGAVGGATASGVAADQVSQGSGGFYQWWGGLAGGLSAGALTWFALGDQSLSQPDVALGLSGGVLGGFAGAMVPTAISADLQSEGRHTVYAASAGALVGLAAATTASLFARPTALDVGEFDLTVVAVNAAVAGTLLTVGQGDDPAPLAGAMVGSAIVSAGLGGLAAWKLELQTDAQIHAGVAGAIGGVAGLFAGGAHATAINGDARHVFGGGLIGVGAGVVVGGGLGVAGLAPSSGGLVYEGWASIVGGMMGAGAGLALMDPNDPNGATLPLALTAGGIVGGAATTAFFPDGLVQEPTDLILQPLFVGLALWHAGVSVADVGLSDNQIAATFLLAPALTSAGIVAASPFISASYGDLALMTSTMAWGAWLSTTGIASADARGADIPPSVWILGTALAMDAGAAVGAGLAVSGIDYIGWRTAYVTAVSAGTTLVLSLPGSLLAAGSGGTVAVSDVLLGSSVLGLGIGLVTMPLIDFRVAPDLGLDGGRHTIDADVDPNAVSMTPTVWALPPLPAQTSMPLIAGAVVRF